MSTVTVIAVALVEYVGMSVAAPAVLMIRQSGAFANAVANVIVHVVAPDPVV